MSGSCNVKLPSYLISLIFYLSFGGIESISSFGSTCSVSVIAHGVGSFVFPSYKPLHPISPCLIGTATSPFCH